jgi:hypothetical protein
VVKQEYYVKKEAPKERNLDLNTINENLISMLENLAISEKYIGQLIIDVVGTKSKQKNLELPKSRKLLFSKIEVNLRCPLNLS